MYKIIATYNNETFKASLPDESGNIVLYLNKKNKTLNDDNLNPDNKENLDTTDTVDTAEKNTDNKKNKKKIVIDGKYIYEKEYINYKSKSKKRPIESLFLDEKTAKENINEMNVDKEEIVIEAKDNKKELYVSMSDLTEYYSERFIVIYKGHKTGIIKPILNKNIVILGTANAKIANKLRFYKSDGNQWCKNINYSDIEKIIVEKYDFLSKEKEVTEYINNFENVLVQMLGMDTKKENENEEQKENN